MLESVVGPIQEVIELKKMFAKYRGLVVDCSLATTNRKNLCGYVSI